MKTSEAPAPKESDIQRAYFQWVRLMALTDWRYKLIKGDCNGAHFAKGFKTAAFQKSMGMLPGWPDVTVPVSGKGRGILFIEFKAGKGRVSDEQSKVLTMLANAGNAVHVIRSAGLAMQITQAWMEGL